jgi:hypothetical protein
MSVSSENRWKALSVLVGCLLAASLCYVLFDRGTGQIGTSASPLGGQETAPEIVPSRSPLDREAVAPSPTSVSAAPALDSLELVVACLDEDGRPVEAEVSVYSGAELLIDAAETAQGRVALRLADWDGCLVSASSGSGGFGSTKIVGSMVQEQAATVVLRRPANLSGQVLAPPAALETGGRISAVRVDPPYRESIGLQAPFPPALRPPGVWAEAPIDADGAFVIRGLERNGTYKLCVDIPGVIVARPHDAFIAPAEGLLIPTEKLYVGVLELVEPNGEASSLEIDTGGVRLSVIQGAAQMKGPFGLDFLHWTHSGSANAVLLQSPRARALWFSSELALAEFEIDLEVECSGHPKQVAAMRLEPCDGRPIPITRIHLDRPLTRGSIALSLTPASDQGPQVPAASVLRRQALEGTLLLEDLANSEETHWIAARLSPTEPCILRGIPTGEYKCRFRGANGAPSLPIDPSEWRHVTVHEGVSEIEFQAPPLGQVELIVELPELVQVPALDVRLWSGPLVVEWAPLSGVTFNEQGKVQGGPVRAMAFRGPPYVIPAIEPGVYVMKSTRPKCLGDVVHSLTGETTEFWRVEALADRRSLVPVRMKAVR